MGVWGSGGSAFEGYDYVQNAQPVNPGEGQTWYDIDGNAAYVFDGNAWVQMTVTDHGQLSGVGANDHHTKPTGTANSGATGEYNNNDVRNNGGSVSQGQTQTKAVDYPDWWYYDGIQISVSSSGLDGVTLQEIRIRDASGSTVENHTFSTNITNSTNNYSYSFAGARGIRVEVQVTGDNSRTGSTNSWSFDVTPRQMALGPHSHSI